MPGPEIHGEITVEHGQLSGLIHMDLKDRALNARAEDDLAGVLLEQQFEQSEQGRLVGGQVEQFGDAAVGFGEQFAQASGRQWLSCAFLLGGQSLSTYYGLPSGPEPLS